jgi:hypothetical protein
VKGYYYRNPTRIPFNNPYPIRPYIYPPPYWFYPPYWALPPVPLLCPPPFPIIQSISSANATVNNQSNLFDVKSGGPIGRIVKEGQYILMTKEEFRDWLFNKEITRKISLIQQHHTWKPDYSDFNGYNHFSLLKGMEYYHVNEMGWKTIAQNLTTFPDGNVAVSRPINIAPEGTIGEQANSEGIAIENLGNFDIGHDIMTEEQKQTIVYITALLCIKLGLTPSIDSITYHHWWDIVTGERVLDDNEGHTVKSCPGTGFFGGNSTTSAKNNFYPLVSRKMQEILATMD